MVLKKVIIRKHAWICVEVSLNPPAWRWILICVKFKSHHLKRGLWIFASSTMTTSWVGSFPMFPSIAGICKAVPQNAPIKWSFVKCQFKKKTLARKKPFIRKITAIKKRFGFIKVRVLLTKLKYESFFSKRKKNWCEWEQNETATIARNPMPIFSYLWNFFS